MPSACSFYSTVLRDALDVSAKPVDCVVGPVDGHRPNSLRIMSVTSPLEWNSPLANCSSLIRKSSRTCSAMRCSFSQPLDMDSQSEMHTSTEVGLPFCVTMMGRCVRRVFSKYSPSLPRHSVKEMTSSERIGRRGPGRSVRCAVVRVAGFGFSRVDVAMTSAPFLDANIVPNSCHRMQVAKVICGHTVSFARPRKTNRVPYLQNYQYL